MKLKPGKKSSIACAVGVGVIGAFARGALAADTNYTWSGATNGTWDSSTTNWKNGATSTTWSNVSSGANSSNAIFSDAATGTTSITLASGIAPDGTVTFSNSSKSYTLSGQGIISNSGSNNGPPTLQITGGGSVKITMNNTLNGGVLINSGTLSITTADAIKTSGTTTLGNGTNLAALELSGVAYSQSFAMNALGTLRGTGTASATGTITIANTVNGGYTIQTGASSSDVLTIGDGANDLTGGVASSTITVSGGGTVIMGQSSNYAGKWNLTGGTLQINNANALGASGTISFNGGTLTYGTGVTADLSGRFSTAANQDYAIDTNGNTVTLTSALASSNGDLHKKNGGVLVLSGVNTYAGDTKISGGAIKLGASNRISNASRLVLDGGKFDTGGNDEILSTLQVTNNSTIDLAGGDSILEFDDSSSETWTAGKTLTILNWDNNLLGTGNDRIYIGTANNGLTGLQLSQIRFVDPVGMTAGTYGATMLEDGQVVVPEPASLSLIGLGASGLLMRRRRKA